MPRKFDDLRTKIDGIRDGSQLRYDPITTAGVAIGLGLIAVAEALSEGGRARARANALMQLRGLVAKDEYRAEVLRVLREEG